MQIRRPEAKIALMLAVIYLPFVWLLFLSETIDYALGLIRMWLALPGLAINALLGFLPFPAQLPGGFNTAFLLAVLWAGGLVAIALQLRRAYWSLLGTGLLASGGFSWIIYVLMKA